MFRTRGFWLILALVMAAVGGNVAYAQSEMGSAVPES